MPDDTSTAAAKPAGITLGDLVVPDTPTSAAALEVASAYQSPALLNHSVRAYVWAAARAMDQGIEVDAELLYVAALLHDMGLVAEFDSHTEPFEVAGGHLAGVFTAGAGWPAERRRRLAEIIVRHMDSEVDVATNPEGHVLSRAAALEILGRNADDFAPDFRGGVLERYPRLGLVAEFLTYFQEQARRKPDSTAAWAVRSGLEDWMADNPLDLAEASTDH
ncbi:HD domain-containing protein [Streptomyces cadmiisoli]|uniref:HD domain-containing protein n=1 Tax=Streptomyces cadmiisoli TaxID=2184053 RepID=UPI001FE788D0|nr:HD domain-containing protein [Streptomyces cadmiisoli]